MLSATVVALLAASPALVDASCFKHGATGNKGKDLYGTSDLSTLCEFLKGEYDRKETRRQCFEDMAGRKWDFQVRVRHSGFHKQILL